jgi:hypothetical protein
VKLQRDHSRYTRSEHQNFIIPSQGAELASKWKKNYKGGKVSLWSLVPPHPEPLEVWEYKNGEKATITSSETADGAPIVIEWDGQFFLPSSEHTFYGAGEWDGQTLYWYKKFQHALSTSGRKAIFLSYNWDSNQNCYEPKLISG